MLGAVVFWLVIATVCLRLAVESVRNFREVFNV